MTAPIPSLILNFTLPVAMQSGFSVDFFIFIGVVVAAVVFTWYYSTRLLPRTELKSKFKRLESTFDERDFSYRLFSKTKDQKQLKSTQSEISVRQRVIRDEIVNYVSKKEFLGDIQIKWAEKVAEDSVKKSLSYYNDRDLSRRLWLLGIKQDRAREIYEEAKDKYADKVRGMKEEGMKKSEIRDRLIHKHGFRENKASEIIDYAL